VFSHITCVHTIVVSFASTEQALPREIFGYHNKYKRAKKQARVTPSSMANGVLGLLRLPTNVQTRLGLTIVVSSKR
jgi:hypothetical protein